jgi:hypothetical protein
VNSVLEIVLDGLDAERISRAMRAGITAACRPGIRAISAGNYGGKLGPHHFHLRTIMEGAVSDWVTLTARTIDAPLVVAQPRPGPVRRRSPNTTSRRCPSRSGINRRRLATSSPCKAIAPPACESKGVRARSTVSARG